MPQFMLILHDADPEAYRKLSPEQFQALIEKYNAWSGKMGAAGKLQGGHKLREEGGRWVTQKSGKLNVVDGPYAEAKEVVGGYFIITANDYAEAVQLVSDCPHLDFGRIEIRETDPMDGT